MELVLFVFHQRKKKLVLFFRQLFFFYCYKILISFTYLFFAHHGDDAQQKVHICEARNYKSWIPICHSGILPLQRWR